MPRLTTAELQTKTAALTVCEGAEQEQARAQTLRELAAIVAELVEREAEREGKE
jgi:hypothetical protein